MKKIIISLIFILLIATQINVLGLNNDQYPKTLARVLTMGNIEMIDDNNASISYLVLYASPTSTTNKLLVKWLQTEFDLMKSKRIENIMVKDIRKYGENKNLHIKRVYVPEYNYTDFP